MVFVRLVPFAPRHPHLRPARIQEAKATAKNFARPQKFSLEKRLRDSFGVQSGQGQHEVVIHFNELVSDYIREKKWHESQELRELEGRRLEFRLKLSSLWKLSAGSSAGAATQGSSAKGTRRRYSRCRPEDLRSSRQDDSFFAL